MNIVYKITNILTDQYYIGVHQTENIDDKYMGSGIRIKRSITKYGRHNFIKTVIAYLPTYEEALALEICLLEQCLKDEKCLNLAPGGKGGATFKGRKHSEETKKKISLKRIGTHYKKSVDVIQKERETRLLKNHGNFFSEETLKKISLKAKERMKNGFKHSEETRRKISQNSKGKRLCEYERTEEMRSSLSQTMQNKYSEIYREKYKGLIGICNVQEKKNLRIKPEDFDYYSGLGYEKGFWQNKK